MCKQVDPYTARLNCFPCPCGFMSTFPYGGFADVHFVVAWCSWCMYMCECAEVMQMPLMVMIAFEQRETGNEDRTAF